MEELGLKDNTKIILIGSTLEQVLEGTPPDPKKLKQKTNTVVKTEEIPKSLSEQKEHKKIIEKGIPKDSEKGEKEKNSPCPKVLKGLLNRQGNSTRLTFKTDEIWISTNEDTQKIPYISIKDVYYEPIFGKEEYHLLYFKVGNHENDKIWVYFVPAQYSKSIKYTVLGMDGFPLLNF